MTRFTWGQDLDGIEVELLQFGHALHHGRHTSPQTSKGPNMGSVVTPTSASMPPETWRCSPAGKLDFHACRVAYINLVIESGVSVKEAQTLALTIPKINTQRLIYIKRWVL
jgi:hypothetical protein